MLLFVFDRVEWFAFSGSFVCVVVVLFVVGERMYFTGEVYW